MKKFVKVLSIIAGIILLFPSSEASARNGEMTLGIGAGYAGYNNGGYVKAFYQYTPINHLRIAPEVGYIFRNNGKSGFEFSLDVHAPFRVAKGFGIYPLAGFTINNWQYKDAGNSTYAGANLGGGLELYMTDNLKLNVQAKYSFMKNTGGCFVDLGIGYVF